MIVDRFCVFEQDAQMTGTSPCMVSVVERAIHTNGRCCRWCLVCDTHIEACMKTQWGHHAQLELAVTWNRPANQAENWSSDTRVRDFYIHGHLTSLLNIWTSKFISKHNGHLNSLLNIWTSKFTSKQKLWTSKLTTKHYYGHLNSILNMWTSKKSLPNIWTS